MTIDNIDSIKILKKRKEELLQEVAKIDKSIEVAKRYNET